MGFFQRTGLALLLAIGLLDTEQLDLHPFRRNRSSVDDDERPFGAARCIMQGCARPIPLPAPEGPTIRMRLLALAARSIV